MEYEIRDFMRKIILDPVVQSPIKLNYGLVEILIIIVIYLPLKEDFS